MMSKPTKKSWERLLRVGRFLKAHPRLVWGFIWQEQQNVVDVSSDSNWAGCHHSRTSTSGGVAAIGAHIIKSWSKSQATVAKSSAEAELYAVVRASTEALGICSLLQEFGVENPKVRLHVDASAAIGMIERRGLSKVRHVEVDLLWIQSQQARRLLPIRKILGTKTLLT